MSLDKALAVRVSELTHVDYDQIVTKRLAEEIIKDLIDRMDEFLCEVKIDPRVLEALKKITGMDYEDLDFQSMLEDLICAVLERDEKIETLENDIKENYVPRHEVRFEYGE